MTLGENCSRELSDDCILRVAKINITVTNNIPARRLFRSEAGWIHMIHDEEKVLDSEFAEIVELMKTMFEIEEEEEEEEEKKEDDEQN